MPKLGTMGEAPRGRRLWLRWAVMGVAVICLAVAFVNLGRWQLDRLQQRRDNNGIVVAHENAPVVDWRTVFTHPLTDADQWQRVRVTGTFDADHSFVVRYRSNADQTGWEIVTPLRTASGSVLVSRGFAARPASQDFPRVAPAPPSGEVTVVGYARRNEQGGSDAMTPVDGQMRLINSDAVAGTLSYPLVNGYIGATEVTPSVDDGLVPVNPPELTEGNHFSYALQWFAFAIIAGIGLVVLIRSDLRDRRRAARLAAAEAAAAEAGSGAAEAESGAAEADGAATGDARPARSPADADTTS
ncbi:MAG: SURF1 family protein [Micropruina sp.]|uniref:SURF1 family cytochrome oxidase biogenesis protein n=1 Tax=Micropruina sp. TaxID=2737536 RepID=UPI0039E2AAE3